MENKNKVIDGVTFYPAAWNKTEKQFIEHEKHNFGGDTEKAKAAYAILTKKEEPATPEKP